MTSCGQELANASKAGDLCRVSRILQSQLGTSVLDANNRDGSTALTQAAEEGRLEVVKVLIQAGADKEKEGQYVYTALMWAAYKGHLGVVKFLVQEAGVDKAKEEKLGHTALILATMSGHLDVVKFLVEAGANIEQEDKDGRTPLIHAACCGHLEVVKYLIGAGAETERVNKSNKTALDLAMTGAIRTVIKKAPLPLNTDLTGCERVLQYIRNAPQRRDMMKQMLLLHAQLEAAAAADDFDLLASHGRQLQALQQQSAQLPLSEEDYLTLPGRHADLVRRVTDKCKQLAATKDFVAVTALGTKLSELRMAAPPVADDDAIAAYRALERVNTIQLYTEQCATIVKQVASAPTRRDLMLQIPALQAQYATALAAAMDFVLVGTLGMKLLALQQQSAKLPLSKEDYLTLPGRHVDLVRRVTDACRALVKARDYAALGPLSAKLKELKALDLSGIAEASGKRETAATAAGSGEGDGACAHDPVVVRDGATAASSAEDARGSGDREEGDDDGANDTVIIVSSSRG